MTDEQPTEEQPTEEQPTEEQLTQRKLDEVQAAMLAVATKFLDGTGKCRNPLRLQTFDFVYLYSLMTAFLQVRGYAAVSVVEFCRMALTKYAKAVIAASPDCHTAAAQSTADLIRMTAETVIERMYEHRNRIYPP